MIAPRTSDPLAASLVDLIQGAGSILVAAQRVVVGMSTRRPTMTLEEAIRLENISTALHQVKTQLLIADVYSSCYREDYSDRPADETAT